MVLIGKNIFLILTLQASVVLSNEEGQSEAKKFLEEYNIEMPVMLNKYQNTKWNFRTNLTAENEAVFIEVSAEMAKYCIEKAKEAKMMDQSELINSEKRQFDMIMKIGTANLTVLEHQQLERLAAKMVETYTLAKVGNRPGDSSGKLYSLTELNDIMIFSEDLETLEWAWKEWRNAAGRPQKNIYKEFIDLQNAAAHNNGYADHGDYLRSFYESESFQKDIEKLYQAIKPFYEEIHTYVRMKLKNKYKDLEWPKEGHIPAHLLKSLHARFWGDLDALVKPMPDKPIIYITEELKKQNYDAKKIVETAESFFVGLGMPNMTQEFWDNSLFEKPENRKLLCHSAAWDFFNQKDFRIKQCTKVTHDWFMATHHEVGHVAYYEQYKKQPISFRYRANPGFHEAQADIASLSVSTPAYLKYVGLLKDYEEMEEDLNFLMQQALKKVTALPFSYTVDLWRWDVYNGTISEKEYNTKWWEARCKYQGVSPAVERTEEDLDPASFFHVASDVPFIRYFVGHILQYQFHEALCKEAGNKKPLYQCSIHNSKEAGEKLREILSMGSSKPWPEALKALTGSEIMSAQSLLNYFKPLRNWLQKQIKGEKMGWLEACPTFERSSMQPVFQITVVFTMVVSVVVYLI